MEALNVFYYCTYEGELRDWELEGSLLGGPTP